MKKRYCFYHNQYVHKIRCNLCSADNKPFGECRHLCNNCLEDDNKTSISIGREIVDKELQPIKDFVRNTFLCSSKKKRGRFLVWEWELWSIGGGSGVEWFRFGKNIGHPGRFNPLWKIFQWQSGEK